MHIFDKKRQSRSKDITFESTRSIGIAGFCGNGDSFYSSCPTVDTLPDYGDDDNDYEPQHAKASSRCVVDYGYGDEATCAPAAKTAVYCPPHTSAGGELRTQRSIRRGSVTKYSLDEDSGEACMPTKEESPPYCAGGELRKHRSIRRGSLTNYSLDGDGDEACPTPGKTEPSSHCARGELRKQRSIRRGSVTKYSLDRYGGEAWTPGKAEPDYGEDDNDYERHYAEASSRCVVDYGYGDEAACAPPAKTAEYCPPHTSAGGEPRKPRSIRRGSVTKYSLDEDCYGEASAPAKTVSPPHYARRELIKQRSIRRGSLTKYSLDGDGDEACAPPGKTAEPPPPHCAGRELRKQRSIRRGSVTKHSLDGYGGEPCTPTKEESPSHSAGGEPRKPRSIRRGSITKYSLDGSHCAGEEPRKERSIRRALDGYGAKAWAPAKTESPPHCAGEEPRKPRAIRRGSITKYSLDPDCGEACALAAKTESPPHCAAGREPRKQRSIRLGSVRKCSLDAHAQQEVQRSLREKSNSCTMIGCNTIIKDVSSSPLKRRSTGSLKNPSTKSLHFGVIKSIGKRIRALGSIRFSRSE
jgi:hypothetical protein